MFRSLLFAVLTATCLATCSQTSKAQSPGSDYYYGDWQKHPTSNYYVRNFYFKPTSNSPYRYHRVAWFPGTTNEYLYFFDPYTQRWWGRCTVYPGPRRYVTLRQNAQPTNITVNINQIFGDNNNIVNTTNNPTFNQDGWMAIAKLGFPNDGFSTGNPTNGFMPPPPSDPPVGQAFPNP